MKLRTYLILLIVAAVLPTVIFAAVVSYLIYREQEKHLTESMKVTAAAISAALDREFMSSIQALKILTASDALDQGRLRGFYEEMKKAREAYGSAWQNITLVDPTGRQVINLRLPFGSALPKGDPQILAQDLRTRSPSISDVFAGPLTGAPSMVVSVPWVKDGEVKYILRAGFPLARLLELLAAQKIPGSWTATIIDRNATIAARNLDSEKYLGKAASPTFRAQAKVYKQAVWRGTTLEGTRVVAVLHRSDFSDWTVGLAVPAAESDAPLNKLLTFIGAGGSVLLLAAIGLSTLFARRIAGSIVALSNTAKAAEEASSRIADAGPITKIAEVSYATRVLEDTAVKRNAAQKALAENEERYRTIFKLSPEAIFIANNEHIVAANGACLKLLGAATADQLLEKSPFEIVHPDYHASLHEDIQVLLAEGSPAVLREHKWMRLDGTTVDVEIMASLLPMGEYHVIQMFGRDITGRNRTRQMLRYNEEWLSRIVATAPGAVCSFRLRPDGTTSFPYASPHIEEFYGIKPENLREDNSIIFTMIHPDDRKYVQDSIAQSARTMSPWHAEFRVQNPRKGDIWLEGHSIPLREPDGSILWHGIVTEITERKATQEELQKLASIITHSNDLIGLASLDARIVFINEAGAKLLGVDDPGTIILTSIFDYIAEEHQTVARRQLIPLLKAGGSWRGEINFRRLNSDRLFTVDATCFAIAHPETRESRLLACIARDITDHKQAEEKIAQTATELRALSARLLRVREEERAVMAREVHDVLGQSLTALKMDLASFSEATARSRALNIKSMAALADEMVRAVRKLASDLRPGVLDDLGLVAALEWQAKEFQRRNGIQCRFESNVDSVSLTRERSTALFRICQESLTQRPAPRESERDQDRFHAARRFVDPGYRRQRQGHHAKSDFQPQIARPYRPARARVAPRWHKRNHRRGKEGNQGHCNGAAGRK